MTAGAQSDRDERRGRRVPVDLPATLGGRHPRAAQAFIPLDVSRYMVAVAGTRSDGLPDLDDLHAVLVPGTVGICYLPGVWHMGATVP